MPVTNLVAWWELINSAGGTGASGSTITDLSGNGNTLTFAGVANPVNPTPGADGLNFTQVIASPTVGATLSIAAGTAKTFIVVFQPNLDGLSGYMLNVNSIGSRAAGVFIEAILVPNASGYGAFSFVPDTVVAVNPRGQYVPNGQWTFGAVRTGGSTAYTQNVNTLQPSAGVGPSTVTVDSVRVGNGNRSFIGKIAEVMIYSGSLTDDELAQVYANLKSRVAAVGIVI